MDSDKDIHIIEDNFLGLVKDEYPKIFRDYIKHEESRSFQEFVENPNFNDTEVFLSSLYETLGRAVVNDFAIDALREALDQIQAELENLDDREDSEL